MEVKIEGSQKYSKFKDYDPKYCEQIIELGKQGLHELQMAMRLDCATWDFECWSNLDPKFRDAFARAKQYSKAVLLDALQESYDNPNFHVNKCEFMAKFLQDYTRLNGYSSKHSLKQQMEVLLEAANNGERTVDCVHKVFEVLERNARLEKDLKLLPMLEEIKAKLKLQE